MGLDPSPHLSSFVRRIGLFFNIAGLFCHTDMAIVLGYVFKIGWMHVFMLCVRVLYVYIRERVRESMCACV